MSREDEKLLLSMQTIDGHANGLRLLSIVLFAIVGLIAIGQAKSDNPVFEAREFILRDDGGARRAVLGLTDEGNGEEPFLALYDKKGSERIRLSTVEGISSVILRDPDGMGRAFLSTTREKTSLTLVDGDGNERVYLLEEPRFTWLAMRDAEDNPRIMLDATEERSELRLIDIVSKHHAVLSISEGEQRLVFTNSQGKPVWKAP